MPADEVHHEDSVESRARTGPRHAAPRKPLLTRLHVPAGKAIAIAAMPTAVLMGMGLTPTLAQAKPLPKNPFRDGPCVTAPDDAGKDTSADKKDDGKDTQDATKEPSASPSSDSTGSGSDSGSGSGSGDKADPTPTPSSSAQPQDDGTKDPESSPSASKTTNPLDPLGVGDAIGNLLDGDKESASPTPTPSASSGSGDSTDSKDDSGSTVDKVTEPVKDTVDDVTGTAKDTADKAGDSVKDAADKAKDAVTPSPSATDPMAADENGKQPYPCVVEKKVDGKDETTPVTLPSEPWYLESSALLLRGLDYKGVVNVTTADGKTKQVLKFTADKVDIGNLHQTVDDGQSGKTYHVQAADGSTSTIRGGMVTMYTERLQGNLFGLIPVVFDPEHPPPINTPTAYFTKVKITQAGQFGGNLTVPGLHQYVTD